MAEKEGRCSKPKHSTSDGRRWARLVSWSETSCPRPQDWIVQRIPCTQGSLKKWTCFRGWIPKKLTQTAPNHDPANVVSPCPSTQLFLSYIFAKIATLSFLPFGGRCGKCSTLKGKTGYKLEPLHSSVRGQPLRIPSGTCWLCMAGVRTTFDLQVPYGVCGAGALLVGMEKHTLGVRSVVSKNISECWECFVGV